MPKAKLLTKAIERKLPGLYETDGKRASERTAWAKFFHPRTGKTWFVLEREGDIVYALLYDAADDSEEFGYSSLAELAEANVERDRWFIEVPLDRAIRHQRRLHGKADRPGES